MSIVAIVAALCWPAMANASFPKALKDWNYPKRIRIASTPAELAMIGSLQTSIKELFPKGKYTASKNGRNYPSQFITDTGWTIDLFSYEQDASEMAGPTIGLLIFNEPMPSALWREGVARLRKGGLILVAMTSLHDEPWVVDDLLNKANGKDIRVIYCDAEENCIQHGVNGSLEHEQIERILAQYDPDEREARKTGKPLSLSGRIYKSFDRAVHVAPQEIILPNSGVSIYQAVDPAIGKPCAILYGFVDGSGTLNIYKEWPEADFEGSKDSNMSVADYAELFKQIEGGRQIETRILDRHFGNVRRTLGGLSLKQEFGEVGVDFMDSYHVAENVAEVETGILKVKEYLRYDKTKPLDAINRPRIIISPTCRNTIASFERWSRDEKTHKPKENYKDFADVVRYLVMANPELVIDRPWTESKQPHYGVGNV